MFYNLCAHVQHEKKKCIQRAEKREEINGTRATCTATKWCEKKRILCKNPSTSWSFKFQTERNWNIVTSSISSISICMQWKHSNGFPNERADRDRVSAHKQTEVERARERAI